MIPMTLVISDIVLAYVAESTFRRQFANYVCAYAIAKKRLSSPYFFQIFEINGQTFVTFSPSTAKRKKVNKSRKYFLLNKFPG